MLVPRRKKTALISGASTGIGEEAAVRMAEKGWLVYAGVRKPVDATKLSGQHQDIHPVILDVTKEDQIAAAIEKIRAEGDEEGLDLLINNAGLMYTGPTEFISMSDVRSQFDVNVFGVIRLTQAALPLIRMGKPGRVINVGSVAAEQFGPYGGMYAATKASLQTISESMRRELGKSNIKVSLVKPGPVRTNFEETFTKIYESYMKDVKPGTDIEKFYGKGLAHLPKAAEPFKKNMVAPRIVVDRIYELATARNPKNITYDTWGSYFTYVMMRWLPYTWVDATMNKIFVPKE